MVFIGFSILIAFFYMGEVSKKTDPEIGVQNEALLACGDKPNCVSSFNSPEDKHFIKPLAYTKDNLIDVGNLLKSMKFQVLKQEDHYLYATKKSAVFGFVDDIELLLKEGQIYFRSSSRVGYSDMGANRKRVNSIKFRISQDL